MLARKCREVTDLIFIVTSNDYGIDLDGLQPGTFPIGPFTVTVDRVNHPIETYGVRVEQGGRVLAYSSDTAPCESLLRLAAGADLFLCEASYLDGADNPPDDVKKLAKMACKANPDDCGVVEGQYKDAIFQFVTPVEDEAKKRWKDTLARASQMGVTNDYVKKARENLSKYLPDEFPFIKDERIGLEYP